MRPIARALTLGLLLSTAVPAWAQDVPGDQNASDTYLRAAAPVREQLAEAARARAAGNCLAWATALNQAERLFEAQVRPVSGAENREAAYNLSQRIAAERGRPCGSTPPEDATMADLPMTGPLGPEGNRDTPLVPPFPDRPEPILNRRQPDGRYLDPITEWPSWARELAGRFEAGLNRAAIFRAQRDCGGWNDEVAQLRALLGARSGPAWESEVEEQVERFYRSLVERETAQPCEWASPEDEYAYGVTLQQRRERDFWDEGGYVAIGYGESEAPPANYGFQRDGAAGTSPERPAAFSERRVATYGIDLGLQIGRFTLNLGYAEGDASNRTDIAASAIGGARGYPYTDNGPSGSTGIGGNVPIVVDTGVSFNQFAPRIAYGWGVGRTLERGAAFLDDDGNIVRVDPDGTVRGARRPEGTIERGAAFLDDNGIVIFVAADGAVRDRDHRGVVSITTPVIATQTLDQDVDELELGVTIGARAIIPLGPRARFTLGGEAGVYFYDFDLRSVETNAQNFGPAADRAFTTTIEDSESGVGYRGGVTAELAFRMRRSLDLFVRGEANYFSRRAQVVNPFSGDFVLAGGTAFLDTDDAFDWQVSIGLRMELRGPNFR